MDHDFDGLAAALRKSKVIVKFSKKDGTTTERLATLQDSVIKESGHVFKEGVSKAPNPAVMIYFELGEKPGFKSFLKTNLISWRLADGENKQQG
jgi:hypothetical protein